MKTCGSCKLPKPEEQFSWKIKGKLRQSYCKDCQRVYHHKHYVANKEDYIQKAAQRTVRLKKEFLERFRGHPCTDCKQVYPPECMDFDHVRGTKVDHVSRLVTMVGRAKLEEELDKCEIVCSNCHRIRTAARGEFYGYDLTPVD